MPWEELKVFSQTLAQRRTGERPGVGWGGSLSLRKEAASSQGTGESKSPLQKGWVSLMLRVHRCLVRARELTHSPGKLSKFP